MFLHQLLLLHLLHQPLLPRAVAEERPWLVDGSMMITARNPPTVSNTTTTPASNSKVVVAGIDNLETVAVTVLLLIDTLRAAKGRSLTVGLSPQRRHRDTLTRNTITAEKQPLRTHTRTTLRTTITATTRRQLDLAHRLPLCTRSKKIVDSWRL